MQRDTSFRPKLGKIGAGRAAKKDVQFFKRIARSMAQSGGRRSGRALRGAAGRPVGAGAQSRAATPRTGARRVMIKASVVKVAGNLGGATAHQEYVERDGVTKDGGKGQLFDQVNDVADGKDFLVRCEDDRHQFRVIVSPEDGAALNLRDYTRELMGQMEADLGTKLEWVAVEHHNTDNPHVHVIVRGVNDRGDDLVIDRAYISHGMRERASEIVTHELGPRTEQDLTAQTAREVTADRYTDLDRVMQRTMGGGTSLDLTAATGSYHGQGYQAILEARCHHLRSLGLATEVRPGHWQVAPNVDKTLRAIGERGDIIKQMHRTVGRPPEHCSIYTPSPTTSPVIGKVAHKGLVEGTERRYLIVDGIDGRSHYVDAGHHPEWDRLRPGAIVEVGGIGHVNTRAEHNIAEVAARSGGTYTPEAHHDLLAEQHPGMPEHRREAIVDTHMARLNVLEKDGVVTRTGDQVWTVPTDLPNRAVDAARLRAFDRQGGKGVMLATLDQQPLARQIEADGATWLDRSLQNRSNLVVSNEGFGREVNAALTARADKLIERGHAMHEVDGVKVRPNLVRALTTAEVERVGTNMAKELGRSFTPLKDGDRFEGTYVRQVALNSGRFAVLDGPKGFQLVPWRPAMDKQLGQQIAGVMRGQSVSLQLGRGLGIGF